MELQPQMVLHGKWGCRAEVRHLSAVTTPLGLGLQPHRRYAGSGESVIGRSFSPALLRHGMPSLIPKHTYDQTGHSGLL